jgi:hypothetical protein
MHMQVEDIMGGDAKDVFRPGQVFDPESPLKRYVID